MFWSYSNPNVLSEEELKTRLNKKNILVVGGTAGIGQALAVSCSKRGANVTVVGRRTPSLYKDDSYLVLE